MRLALLFEPRGECCRDARHGWRAEAPGDLSIRPGALVPGRNHASFPSQPATVSGRPRSRSPTGLGAHLERAGPALTECHGCEPARAGERAAITFQRERFLGGSTAEPLRRSTRRDGSARGTLRRASKPQARCGDYPGRLQVDIRRQNRTRRRNRLRRRACSRGWRRGLAHTLANSTGPGIRMRLPEAWEEHHATRCLVLG